METNEKETKFDTHVAPIANFLPSQTTQQAPTENKPINEAKEVTEPKKEAMHVMNIKEMKKSQLGTPEPGEALWYNKLGSWILFGSIVGFIFILLSIYNSNFLILIPAGPVIGASAWFIRRAVNDLDPYKEDVLK